MSKSRSSPNHLKIELEEIIEPSSVKIMVALGGVHKKTGKSNNQTFDAKKTPKESPHSPSKRNSKLWVVKMSSSTLAACCEVVGQEALRLFFPEQKIKTRFTLVEGVLGIASEKLMNFLPIDEAKVAKKFKGLGTITLLAKFFNETDLKLGHLDANTAAKIDGDWMFSSLLDKKLLKNSEMTTEEIQKLPYVYKYNANQWLDQIEDGKEVKTENPLAFTKLGFDDDFQLEVNQTILMLLLMPDALIDKFVTSYVKEGPHDLILKMWLDQKLNLLSAALKYPGFRAFVNSGALEKLGLTDRLAHIREFTTTKKNRLIPEEDYPDFKKTIENTFKLIVTRAKQEEKVSSSVQIVKPIPKRLK